MAASRFVNVSDEDISQFLEENEKKNTARKASRYVINKLLHVESLIPFFIHEFLIPYRSLAGRLACSRYGIKNS